MERFRVIEYRWRECACIVLDRARRKAAPYSFRQSAENAAECFHRLNDYELERLYHWIDCPPEHAFACAIYHAQEASACNALS